MNDQDPRPFHRDPRVWAMGALLVIGIVVAFLPILHNGFVNWDDDKNFVTNLEYRGLGASHLRWAWTTTLLGVYQPLAWMLLELQYTLWGMAPSRYHAASLALHAATIAALYALTLVMLRRFGPAHGNDDGRATIVCAGVVTLAFAVHPLRVESVAWVSCQPYLPCALLYVLAVLTYLQAHHETSRRTRWLVTCFVLFVGALLFKAPAATMPAVLLLLDWYPLKRLGRGRAESSNRIGSVWLEKLPFVALSVAFLVIALAAKRGAPTLTTLQLQPNGFGAGQVAMASYDIWFYLAKTIHPVALDPYYPLPRGPHWWRAPEYLACMAGAVSVTGLLLWKARQWPALLVTWLAYLAILVPNLGLVTVSRQLAADRYTYIATMPLVIIASAGGVACWRALAPKRTGVMGLAATAAIVFLIAATWRLSMTWRDSEHLWAHIVSHSGATSPEAHHAFGVVLAGVDRLDDAEREFSESVRLNPQNAEAQHNLGTALARLGRFDEALAHFTEAVRLNPAHGEAHLNLASIYMQRGALDQAAMEYERLLEADPENAIAVTRLGAIVQSGRPMDPVVRERARAMLAGKLVDLPQ
jgi:tetratricopeptide (TPR) repeat protein